MNSFPKAAPESAAAGIRTRDLLIASPAPYHYATEPHTVLSACNITPILKANHKTTQPGQYSFVSCVRLTR